MGLCYKLREVGFRYDEPWIFRDFSLEISEGELLGLIGPNGSGKTSLLKVMAGLLSVQQGAVMLRGHNVAGMSPRAIAREVAIVPQESQILFPFTVGELVLMGRFVHQRGWGWESAEDLRIGEWAMGLMDVAHAAHRTVQELSGGERQRVMIARALAQQSRILLLDEPTAFLDLKHQIDIYAILKALNRDRGATVILVSHDLNLASQYCDRLLLLHKGEIFADGTPEEVLTGEHLLEVYGCEVLIDRHPVTGTPRITLPSAAATLAGSHKTEGWGSTT